MLVDRITSRQNPLVKRFRRVRAGDEHHLVFIEGVRLIEEAVRVGVHFESVVFSSELETTDRGLVLLESLQRVPCRGAYVSDPVMDAIADTESPQGVAALVSRPYFEIQDLFASQSLIVIADQLQNPGNLGSIVRSAHAAGASGLVAMRGTVDPFNPKALRASMGSAFRLPIVTDVGRAEALDACSDRGVKVLAARLPSPGPTEAENASKPYTQVDLSISIALVVGGEAGGVSGEVTGRADQIVHIPMGEGVESLNAAAAAAIILYESARQRGFEFTRP